jgi:hypothetical protein
MPTDNPIDCGDGGPYGDNGWFVGLSFGHGEFFDDWNDPRTWPRNGGGAYGSGGANSVAFGIFQGQDCPICQPLGPSPVELLQEALSGNLYGALQGAGAIPRDPNCEFGTCNSSPEIPGAFGWQDRDNCKGSGPCYDPSAYPYGDWRFALPLNAFRAVGDCFTQGASSGAWAAATILIASGITVILEPETVPVGKEVIKGAVKAGGTAAIGSTAKCIYNTL